MPTIRATRRGGFYPVRTYLPDWAQRVLAVLKRHPHLLPYLAQPAGPFKQEPSARDLHDRLTHTQRGPSMTDTPPLHLHHGDRDRCVRTLQQALYRALMTDDSDALEQALTLDQRLSHRAALTPIDSHVESAEPASSKA